MRCCTTPLQNKKERQIREKEQDHAFLLSSVIICSVNSHCRKARKLTLEPLLDFEQIPRRHLPSSHNSLSNSILQLDLSFLLDERPP